ncbi:hypothetical protein CK203_040990 [Vitis vinifera]|uniref:Retrotransposon gag domain-containing protein n=1 Tax=Vitis vinifera TaxID=29760 RepID=A0A438HVB7_VITVI|nr:hypothetical protein CK203_040990 [Vitis vinifera]
MHGAAILSGTPQGKANDVSASPIQGRANDAGRAWPHLPKVDHLVERKKIITNGVKPSKKDSWRAKKQLRALFQETERLREENAVLRIQASTSGPPRRQRSKGQVANSRPEPESIYLGSTGAVPGTYNARPHEPRTPMPRAPREESSDSTHFSAKRQRDRKSQLSSSMRARLGPQEPGRSRPPVATTRAPRPDSMIAPMVQNVPPHRDPMVTPAMRNVHSHLAERPAGRNLPNEPPIGSISKRLDDMLSTPFCSHITHYEPPRGFLVPKFSTYDGTNDPFDHIMHYRQLMTLDIGNDALLCKVFPASLQGQALSWFHRLPPNSVDNFRDLSEAFVGQYLCSARHKQNISTLQNIKMKDNESLREFVKRFGQAVLQVEVCSMDAVLQIFKRSIYAANKYSMLEDDVRAATQQVLVAGRASRDNVDRHAKPPDRPKPVDRRQDGPSRPDRPSITPLSISYEKLLPMIQGLSDFRWPRPLETDPSIRDRSKKCAFHKDHGHTTETCRSLQYLVERLIKAGHLKQYLRSDTGGRDASQHHNSGAPRAPVAPKAVINYINGGPSDEEYDSRRKRQKLLRAASIRERINSIRPGRTGEGPRPIDGTIIFPPVDPTRTLQPHRDALILSLEIGDFDVRRILVDPGSSADLVQASVIGHMGHSLAGLENPGRILSGFNGSSTTSLGDIILSVRAGPVTLNVQFSVVQELSPFNIILGRTWLHYMKAIPSTYHQMVSFLTNEGQTDLLWQPVSRSPVLPNST